MNYKDWFKFQNLQQKPTYAQKRAERKLAQTQREEVAREKFYECTYCGTPLFTRERLQLKGFEDILIQTPLISGVKGKDKRFYFMYATIDHIIEIAKGGKSKLENMTISCYFCNARRSMDKQIKESEGKNPFHWSWIIRQRELLNQFEKEVKEMTK